MFETKDKDWEAGYFVEMDRGNAPWAKKVAHYERAWRQSAWQVIFQLRQYPPVLCVVPRRLQRAVEETIREKQPVTRFYFKNWDDFLADEVFEGWRLAGSEGVYRLGQGGMNSG